MKKILFKVTGSVAAFKAAALASKLVQSGFDVRVVLSGGAKEFIGSATFEGLTRNRVYDSTFAAGDAMAHIDLARWADLTLIYPASANTLTKLSQGRAEDLIGTLFLAHDFKTPYWIVPAMNPSMWSHPAVGEAITKLKAWGLSILDPDSGRMACGEVGSGRLIEPEAMLTEIQNYFSGAGSQSSSASSLGRVLVTAGGTIEEIDPVRVLTNVSTGETGVRIANELASAGFEATLLLSSSSPFRAEVSPSVKLETFRTFEDLDSAMKRELGRSGTDTLVHAAAVSDYHVSEMKTDSGKKLDRGVKIHSKEGLTLSLSPNPKILDQVRAYAGKIPLKVVSFKLATPGEGEKTADLSGYTSDYIVYNTAANVERGTERHAGAVYEAGKNGYSLKSEFKTKADLTAAVVGLCRPAKSAGKEGRV